MWPDEPPPLVDSRYIPPPGAVQGGQPVHGAFPGYHPQQQQPAHNWWEEAAAQATPWAGGGGWGNTPGSSWANTPGPSPHGAPPWGQQQHQQPPWAPQMPRQGWGPATTPGMQSPWGGGHTPWDGPPPQSAPATMSHGFNALAAPPPEVSSAQPIMNTNWFAGGASGGGRMHGMPGGARGGGMLDDDDEWEPEDREDWHDPRDAWARDPSFAQAQGQQDPRPMWPQMQQDPQAAWLQQDAWRRHEHELALTRTHSLGAPSPKRKKKRANSFGEGQLQGWGAPVTFDEHHLARRPHDWREGYSPRGSAGPDISSFSSFFRVGKKSDSGTSSFSLVRPGLSDVPADYTDTKKRSLAPVLTYSSRPRITFDLRRAPQDTTFMGPFQPQRASDMTQPAVTPAASRMRLMHPRLPWYIEVHRAFDTPGITLYDVLRTLFDELDKPIAARDFWCEELSPRDRAGLTRAFKERCAMDGRERAEGAKLKGVKRVDFLGPDFVFVGLARRSGVWEIKTTNDH
ncbi:hypothetical protein C8R44DRAFT_179376 [Mycena epipterygia]|nr:hypothetical protein C8R44DRAFT_179376 [Mycena epipterygia]